MSNYPDGFDDTLLNEAPKPDYADIDALCGKKAEVKLAAYSVEQAAASEDDLVVHLANEIDKAIADALPHQSGFDCEQDDFRAGLKTTYPKLHAALEAM